MRRSLFVRRFGPVKRCHQQLIAFPPPSERATALRTPISMAQIHPTQRPIRMPVHPIQFQSSEIPRPISRQSTDRRRVKSKCSVPPHMGEKSKSIREGRTNSTIYMNRVTSGRALACRKGHGSCTTFFSSRCAAMDPDLGDVCFRSTEACR